MVVYRNILSLFFLMLALTVAAQQKKKTTSRHGHRSGYGAVVAPPPPEPVFITISEQAIFPGGGEALDKYLDKALRYPEWAREDDVEGKVIVRFVIDAGGNVIRPRIIRSLFKPCDEEALRVVKSMPKWKPAKMNGQRVSTVYELPLVFKINH